MNDIDNLIKDINSISKCKPVTIGIEIYNGYYRIYWMVSSSVHKKDMVIETKNPNDLLGIILKKNIPEGYRSSDVKVWSENGPNYITFYKE